MGWTFGILTREAVLNFSKWRHLIWRHLLNTASWVDIHLFAALIVNRVTGFSEVCPRGLGGQGRGQPGHVSVHHRTQLHTLWTIQRCLGAYSLWTGRGRTLDCNYDANEDTVLGVEEEGHWTVTRGNPENTGRTWNSIHTQGGVGTRIPIPGGVRKSVVIKHSTQCDDA